MAVKVLVILNGAPYGDERTYNGLRLAGSLAQRDGVEVRLFLAGDAATAAKAGQKTSNGSYNVERMLQGVLGRGGAVGG